MKTVRLLLSIVGLIAISLTYITGNLYFLDPCDRSLYRRSVLYGSDRAVS